MEDSKSEPSITLGSPAASIAGIGNLRAQLLQRLNLRTAGDMLFFFPRDYEFPAPPCRIDQLKEGVEASLIGTIADVELRSSSPTRSILGAVLENETGAIRIVFFNQPFRAEQLTYGRKLMIQGTPKVSGMGLQMSHPKITYLDKTDGEIETPRILPIYPLTEGMKQHEIRRIIQLVIEPLADDLPEVLPTELRDLATQRLRAAEFSLQLPLLEINQAIKQIHWPDDKDHLKAARMRFVFQELLVMQLALATRRKSLQDSMQSVSMETSNLLDTRIINRFPFELTDDQRSAMRQISEDMSRKYPMNRLLQGDVGSGKTVVAIYGMMLAVGNKQQAALMAPTEVLARQHYETLTRMLADSRVTIGLLCGSLSAKERRDTLAAVAGGEVDLIVGTQSLLHGIEFANLGLCVIDEQHKFGVGQRGSFRSGGVDPHYLVMSATPIPRSVAMTVFGDTELTTLREKPPGRGTVKTYLGRGQWTQRWWGFVKQRLDEGRQAYVVAPRVASSSDSDEDEDVSSVLTVFKELSQKQFADYSVALLHGKMPNDEKQRVMESFADGEIDLLVTTTVIEVGIDVPNATVMTIMSAERFGLAQLHQLRGRISRSSHTGHVCVFTSGEQNPDEIERLKTFETVHDGFELAEADFKLRGPGDVLGWRQSGMPAMRIADIVEDIDVLQVARQIAQDIIDQDPKLESESYQSLRKQMMRRYASTLNVGDVT
ncbi:ATP-dependent DNA helicase RecG [Stieleria bergensis]|uniref:Probable DNA 3'-5' helicase RecG n=1 Tax=Stieleria bergensis TaxID=2528025 RepID=A0A517SX47_9BACT|nr:ATP-dependent DNA helicase RecG [Planctomycetes bacterium SV_7m_r]